MSQEYKTKLRYHSSRPPTEEMVKKICESLDLAGDIVDDAYTKLLYTLTDSKRHLEFQKSQGDTCIPDTKIAKEAARYHFGIDAPCPEEEFTRIMKVIEDTLDGLEAVNGDVTLSDLFGQFRWDLYNHVNGLSWDHVQEELRGEHRREPQGLPTTERVRTGYVLTEEGQVSTYVDPTYCVHEPYLVTRFGETKAQVWRKTISHGSTLVACGEAMRHKSEVNSARFSPDGKWVVTASRDKTARVWETGTGHAVGEPMVHADAVYSAWFSPDGQHVVTACKDGTARVWEAATGQASCEPMVHADAVYSAQFSPDGQHVVTACEDGTARVWEAATGQASCEPMVHAGIVYSAQFSPNGQYVVTASGDKTARVWEAATGGASSEPMNHKGVVRSARFSPDGKQVVTASDDETAQVWDSTTGKAVGEPMKHDDAVLFAMFVANGKQVSTVLDDRMQLWDVATRTALGKPANRKVSVLISKGIHIEFSDVTKYPRLLLALRIIHEATHKFAYTEDHAYTDEDKYQKLTVKQRIENADSFAYTVISIALNQLIKDLGQFLKVVPRDDQRGPKKARE